MTIAPQPAAIGDPVVATAAAPAAPSSGIRKLEARDLDSLARLFGTVFLRGNELSVPSLKDDLRKLYVDPLAAGQEIGSLVHTGPDGDVNGFIGVIPMPFLIGHELCQAAFCGTLMVDPKLHDPLAGVKLLRGFLAGPQDISLSETANDVSVAMWTRLRGRVLSDHSLDWLKVIRPAAFAASLAGTHYRTAEWLRPLAPPLDWLARRAMPALPRAAGRGLTVREVESDEFANLLEQLTAHHLVRPFWQGVELPTMIADARTKPRYGAMTLGAVFEGAQPIGLFAYHAQPAGVAHVLQVAALPDKGGAVVDRLILHAAERGFAGLRGRTQPWLLEILVTRRCLFLGRTSTVLHSRNPALSEQVAGGNAFINGFAGESWTRLIGQRKGR